MENVQDELGRELERSKLLWIRYGQESLGLTVTRLGSLKEQSCSLMELEAGAKTFSKGREN